LTNLLAALLILEAFGSAHALAGILPGLGAYGVLAILLLAARLIIAAGQLVAGVRLWRREPSANALARAVLAASAVLLTVEIGWRLAPTNSDPTFRWWFVGGYWIYAAIAISWLRRAARSSR
jgi:hypothetical protein